MVIFISPNLNLNQVLIWADFALPGTIGNSYTGFCSSQLRGGCYWHLVGKARGCCQASYDAQDSPRHRMVWLNVSVMLRPRNPGLHAVAGEGLTAEVTSN